VLARKPRRRLLLRLTLCGFLGLLAVATPPSVSAAESEMRGVWLNPPAFAIAHRDKTLKNIIAGGFNTIFTRAPSIKTNFGKNTGAGDPQNFSHWLDRCKQKGLAVHAWVTNKQRTGAQQVDFTDKTEQRAQAAWAAALLKAYPKLDGIHFDYIRYGQWKAPNEKQMAGIRTTLALTRKAMTDQAPGTWFTAAVFTAQYSYLGGAGTKDSVNWQTDTPDWYRKWYATHPENYFAVQPEKDRLAGLRKDLKPNFRYGPNFMHYQQDPPRWLHEGLIDAVMPMRYTSELAPWQQEAAVWKSLTGPKANRIYMGLGWLTEKGHPDWHRNPQALVAHIRYGRKLGYKGFCLFALGVTGVDDGPMIKALGQGKGEGSKPDGPFAKPAASPLIRSRISTPEAKP
jgi:uncharacterized lipoprotein YddW (UPF0748 family)